MNLLKTISLDENIDLQETSFEKHFFKKKYISKEEYKSPKKKNTFNINYQGKWTKKENELFIRNLILFGDNCEIVSLIILIYFIVTKKN